MVARGGQCPPRPPLNDTPHIHVHVYNVHTQHTSRYTARSVAEEGILEGLAYFGKAQWLYTFHSHT